MEKGIFLLQTMFMILFVFFSIGCDDNTTNITKFVTLEPDKLNPIRTIDSRLVSYNVEMTEVTGGTFWKKYSPEQINGKEKITTNTEISDFSNFSTSNETLMEYFPPIELANKKLVKLAKEIGPSWIRVSGTWATKTYYDFDNSTNGIPPEGFDSVLTEEQWKGVLDFVKAVDGKLLISVANNDGIHNAKSPWTPEQAKLIFDYSKNYGVPISAVEFVNEPNLFEMSGLPKGYTGDDYARDQDIFCKFVRENYPETLLVGPCMMMDALMEISGVNLTTIYETTGMKIANTDEMLENTNEKLDVFSYHCYSGVSERIMPLDPKWTEKDVLSNEFLTIPKTIAEYYIPFRNKYVTDGQMWVTESADAAGGGSSWASTYLDVLRTLDELASFATVTDGVIFHNTLASSDYGWLKHNTFDPRPNYFAVVLWNKLMGTTVYDAGENSEGAHIYAHSRKDGKNGFAYLIINNSIDGSTEVNIPKSANVYMLTAKHLRDTEVQLNGETLVLDKNDNLPEFKAKEYKAGKIILPPGSCTFIIM